MQKLLVAIVATVFTLGAYAQAPKTDAKAEPKAKAETKAKTEKKAKAPKKDAAKEKAKTEAKK